MTENQDFQIGMSMLDDLTKQVDTFNWYALSFSMVRGSDPIVSPDESDEILEKVKLLLGKCEIVEKKIGSDREALSLFNFVRGRLYALYLPGTLRLKSHKKEAISYYVKAIELTDSNKNKGLIKYYLAHIHGVWNGKQEKIKYLEEALNLLTVEDPIGMEAAKDLEELKAEKKGMCFIATAVYGSPLVEDVIVLLSFRDEVLEKSRPGRAFITVYYQLSPPLAWLISRSEVFKGVIRKAFISPLVRVVKHFQIEK